MIGMATQLELAHRVLASRHPNVSDVARELAADVIAQYVEIERLKAEVAMLGKAQDRAEANEKASHAENIELRKLLPRCLGTWLSGSGGHRRYDFNCQNVGTWDVGNGFVCADHVTQEGGDDDAWEWDKERTQYKAALREALKMASDSWREDPRYVSLCKLADDNLDPLILGQVERDRLKAALREACDIAKQHIILPTLFERVEPHTTFTKMITIDLVAPFKTVERIDVLRKLAEK